jgi:hypothetical protein
LCRRRYPVVPARSKTAEGGESSPGAVSSATGGLFTEGEGQNYIEASSIDITVAKPTEGQ